MLIEFGCLLKMTNALYLDYNDLTTTSFFTPVLNISFVPEVYKVMPVARPAERGGVGGQERGCRDRSPLGQAPFPSAPVVPITSLSTSSVTVTTHARKNQPIGMYGRVE